MALTADVTLYAPDHTPTGIYISRTGDVTVKPVSTAASGQTAYEVQFSVTGAVEVNPSTTSSLDVTTSQATTCEYTLSRLPPAVRRTHSDDLLLDTLLVDATKVNVAHTVDAGPNDEDVYISETECIRRDDGNFVCEEKGELIRVNISPNSTSTTTSATSTTYTAPAQALYTIEGSESGATSLTFTSGGSAMAMAVLTTLGLTVGLLLG